MKKTSAALLLFLACLGTAFGQAVTGGMFGSVTDSSGGNVPEAKIKLLSVGTGAQRTVPSNHSGEFVIDGLEPGEYSVTVTAAGFKTLERKGIVLSPSERLALGNLSLEVGTMDQHVTVTAEGATVQTGSSELSSSITTEQTEDLPVYGRIVTSLITLAPGVVDPATSDSTRSLAGTGATNFNVAGNRATSNNFSVDGITMTAVGGAANGTFMPSMESISEVKVLISNYQAEYGRLSGSDVQLVTKSGTLQYNGMGMYYGRNEALNANNFFNNLNRINRPVNRYNAATYNIGGPIWIPARFPALRNKLFFFWNQEFVPKKVSGAQSQVTMPTAAQRAGDFGSTTVTDPLTGVVFPNNLVPASRIDRNGLALLNVFPLPNSSVSTAYNYVTQASTAEPVRLDLLKLDFHPRTSDVFSVTLHGNYETDTGPANDAAVSGITVKFPLIDKKITQTNGQMASARYTHVFSPKTINQFVFGYALDFGPTETFDQNSVTGLQRSTRGFNAGQLNAASNPLNLLPGMTFGGITNAPSLTFDGRFPYYLTRYVTDINDNVTHITGSHTFKAGFMWEHMRESNGLYATNFNGTFDFQSNVNNPLNTGNAFSNALLGVFYSYTEATAHPNNVQYSNGLDTFVEDTWRVTHKLTLDYGLRVSFYEPFFTKNNEMAGFVPSLFNPAQAVQLIRPALVGGKSVGINPVTGQTYPSVLVGFIAPGTGNLNNGIVVAANTPGYPRALINNMGPLTAPRVGFAYDPFGDGKSVIRGGFGIFYNRPLDINSGPIFAYPLVQTPVVQFGTLSTFTSTQGFVAPPSVTAWQKDAKSPTVMNMSLTVQRNLGWGTVLAVGYVGSLGRHLLWATNLQPVPLGAQFLASNANPVSPSSALPNAFLYPLQGYNSVTYDSNDGTSNYHSLQVAANRRFTSGLQFGLAYTWSKAMDWTDTDYGAVNNAVPTSLFRAWNYGLAGFDRTQLLKINWMWAVPKWKSAWKPLRPVINDWNIYGVATFSVGAPALIGYNQSTATNITGTPSVTARINVNGNPYDVGTGYGPLQAFNPTVFSAPAVGTLGNPSRNLIRGPGIGNFNISLAKSIPVWERVRMQFRLEMYNAFNHTQFLSEALTATFNAAGAQTNAQFGQYNAARDPRTMQWALRLQF